MLELFTPLLNNGIRYAIEQALKKDIRFGPEISAFDLEKYAFLGRRVYCINVRVLIKGDYNIKLIDVSDGSGDGIIFFPAKICDYTGPFIGWYYAPNVSTPRHGSMSFNEIELTQDGFDLYFATDRPLKTAWIDLRYTVLNEKQSQRRALLRIPLEGNDTGF